MASIAYSAIDHRIARVERQMFNHLLQKDGLVV